MPPTTRLPMQVAALKDELDKQRVKAKADRKDLDALSELSAVHSEVFMDVQKKLESHGQVRALKCGWKYGQLPPRVYAMRLTSRGPRWLKHSDSSPTYYCDGGADALHV